MKDINSSPIISLFRKLKTVKCVESSASSHGVSADVEAATDACKSSLRYVVAFAGRGAKDVTHSIVQSRTRLHHIELIRLRWTVLLPLKKLESKSTSVVNEDNIKKERILRIWS
nr:hypothetical protein [Tanacetum cinerariifolium]